MNRLPVSQQLRDAATRIASRVPLRGGLIEGAQAEEITSDAWRVLDLADKVEQMETQARPLTKRERRALRLSRRIRRRLRSTFTRAFAGITHAGGW